MLKLTMMTMMMMMLMCVSAFVTTQAVYLGPVTLLVLTHHRTFFVRFQCVILCDKLTKLVDDLSL